MESEKKTFIFATDSIKKIMGQYKFSSVDAYLQDASLTREELKATIMDASFELIRNSEGFKDSVGGLNVVAYPLNVLYKILDFVE